MRRGLCRLLGGLAALGALAGPASAELRTVRGLGVAPAPAGDPEALPALRDRAVRQALRDAVVGVAEEVVARTPGIPPVLAPEELLGPDPAEYVPSYRILEDRGVVAQSPLGGDRPGPHYVVLVEATVDASAIRREVARAATAGGDRPGESEMEAGPDAISPQGTTPLPPVPRPDSAEGRLLLVLEEAESYPAVQAVRRLLVEDLGAVTARPVVWEPGRVVLEVETPLASRTLAARLRGLAPSDLALEVLEVGPARVTIRAALRRFPAGTAEGRAVPRFPD